MNAVQRTLLFQSQARGEGCARLNLERRGFPPICRATGARAAMPGVATRCGRHAPWRSVNGTFGVSHLVCQGDQPAPVPDGAAARLPCAAMPDSPDLLGSGAVGQSI